MVTQLVRHMTTAAEQRNREIADSDARWINTNRGFIDDLIFNTGQRIKSYGFKKAQRAVELHTKFYEETYGDVWNDEMRDDKVQVFFEPLIDLFNGDRKAALVELKRALNYYFPIPPRLNREWNPVWKTVPYTPKRKSDKRTQRVTLQFNWKVKKPK